MKECDTALACGVDDLNSLKSNPIAYLSVFPKILDVVPRRPQRIPFHSTSGANDVRQHQSSTGLQYPVGLAKEPLPSVEVEGGLDTDYAVEVAFLKCQLRCIHKQKGAAWNIESARLQLLLRNINSDHVIGRVIIQ